MADTPQNAADRRLFGVALSFPLRANASGYMAVAEGVDLIKESLEQLIMTDPMERPYRVRNGITYGTRIRRLMFESIADARAIAVPDIRRAIAVWEPRVVLLDTTLEDVSDPLGGNGEGATLGVRIRYRVKNTGAEDFHVFTISKEGQP